MHRFIAFSQLLALFLIRRVDALPISKAPVSPSFDTWIYMAVIASISILLAFLVFLKRSFSRWRRHSTKPPPPQNGNGLIHAIQSPVLDFPKRCLLSSFNSRLNASPIMVGLLGSPTWEVASAVNSTTISSRRWSPQDHKRRSPRKPRELVTLPIRSPVYPQHMENSLCQPSSKLYIFHANKNSVATGRYPSTSPFHQATPFPSPPSVQHYGALTSRSIPRPRRNSIGTSFCYRSLSYTVNLHSRSASTPHFSGILKSNIGLHQPSQDIPSPLSPSVAIRTVDVLQEPLHPDSTSLSSVDYAGRSVRLVGSFEVLPLDSSSSSGLKTRGVSTSQQSDLSSSNDPWISPSPTPPSLLRRPSPYRTSRSPPVRPSPLRSMMLPASSSEEVSAFLLSEEQYSPSNPVSSSSGRALRLSSTSNSNPNTPTDHTGQRFVEVDTSPSSSRQSHRRELSSPHQQSSATHRSGTLEDMIHQLVRETSEWDDSLFVSDDFKILIETSKAPARLLDGGSLLVKEGILETDHEAEEAPSHYSNLHHGTELYSYIELPRSPLFSIPEEEAFP